MVRLSTHVLDTTLGAPASGVTIDLYRIEDGSRNHLARAVTDSDGRAGQIVPPNQDLQAGTYELAFQAGDYFRRLGVSLPAPPFLDEVVVRFGLADPNGKYHVPLLLSPFGYSTYRGS
jgi:5-hydroxyisourate hydrolase